MTHINCLDIFKKTGALTNGHFRLSSGMHSDIYFQCAKVIQYPTYLEEIAINLSSPFKNSSYNAVISPAIGGIVIGTEVGRISNVKTIFSERKQGVMKLRRGFEIKQGEQYLVVEDVVTTGGSIREVIEIVESRGSIVTGVAFIVNRSQDQIRLHKNQHSLLNLKVKTYQPDQCPLCKKGHPLVSPGSKHTD